MSLGKKGNFSERYVGPSKILQRDGEVNHELALPTKQASAHQVVHVSMLINCVGDLASTLFVEGLRLINTSIMKRFLLRFQTTR